MVLYINCCTRKESRTKRLAEKLLERLGAYEEVNLYEEALLPMDEKRLERRYELIGKKQFDAEEFRLARQFAAADRIVIAAPYWDLSFPSVLKLYLENIYILGIVTEYDAQGRPSGLCRAEKFYYVTTAGGPCDTSYGFEYVRTMFRDCFGISESALVKAEMLDIAGNDPEKILQDAIDRLPLYDPFFRLVEEELPIRGIRGDYRILQFSDLHLAYSDESDGEEERKTAEKSREKWNSLRKMFADQYQEPFDEYKTISPEKIFGKMMELSEVLQPDLLVLSGDLLDYCHKAGVELIRRALLGYSGKYLLVQGNHDQGDVLAPSAHPQTIDLNELQIIGIDNSQKTVTAENLKKLEKLVDSGKPTIVVQHIPLSTEKNREAMEKISPDSYFVISDEDQDPTAAAFARLERDHPAVKAVLCGHIHGHQITEISDGKKQFCCSSALAGFAQLLHIHGMEE